MTGFVYSQVLMTCAKLKIFELLRESPLTVTELSTKLSMPEKSIIRLMSAAASLRLVSLRNGGQCYGLGELGAAFAGNRPATFMAEHLAVLYEDLADTTALLRGKKDTNLSRIWTYSTETDEKGLQSKDVASYTEILTETQPMFAQELFDCYRLNQHKCLMDIGGGDGAFLIQVAAQYSNLKLMLFEIPAVCDFARIRIEKAGISFRVEIHEGNFFNDPIPHGADVITLFRTVIDHPDEPVLALLRGIRSALPKDGVLLIVDPMDRRGSERIATVWGLYGFGVGRDPVRTVEEFKHLLLKSGFSGVRLLDNPIPSVASVIAAKAS